MNRYGDHGGTHLHDIGRIWILCGVYGSAAVSYTHLVHISQITDRYIKHPLEAVSVGDIVDVQVLTVDVAKKRIGLTMKIQKQ